jgi:hypothetical protein
LEHDPEKWTPVFPRDKRGTRLRGDHAQIKEIEWDGDSKKRHAALVFRFDAFSLRGIYLENAMAKKGPWFCFYQKVWL